VFWAEIAHSLLGLDRSDHNDNYQFPLLRSFVVVPNEETLLAQLETRGPGVRAAKLWREAAGGESEWDK